MKLSIPQKTVAQDPARFKTVIAGKEIWQDHIGNQGDMLSCKIT